jgi:phosphoribosylanthranilate isomerase
MPLVKICGITREEDAVLCAELGADFLGFVFVESSPRCVTSGAAVSAAAAGRRARRDVLTVGVFQNASPDHVNAVAETVGLDLAQLHGDESNAEVARIRVPVIKALRVGAVPPDPTLHGRAAWHLFDGAAGGSGRTFDWSLLAAVPRVKPFFLAGGVTPANARTAIDSVQPDAIDVSSGVESAPGIKDPQKVRALLRAVRTA